MNKKRDTLIIIAGILATLLVYLISTKEWNWYEIREGIFVSLIFIVAPLLIHYEWIRRKQNDHNEWMAQSIHELHMKTNGEPPSKAHPHYKLGK